MRTRTIGVAILFMLLTVAPDPARANCQEGNPIVLPCVAGGTCPAQGLFPNELAIVWYGGQSVQTNPIWFDYICVKGGLNCGLIPHIAMPGIGGVTGNTGAIGSFGNYTVDYIGPSCDNTVVTACTTDADCVFQNACIKGVCAGGLNTDCTTDADCSYASGCISGICADGIGHFIVPIRLGVTESSISSVPAFPETGELEFWYKTDDTCSNAYNWSEFVRGCGGFIASVPVRLELAGWITSFPIILRGYL